MRILHTKINIQSLLQTIPLRTSILILVSAFILTAYGLIVLVPKEVAYAYSGENCVHELTILPANVKQSGKYFRASFKDVVSVGSMQLFATRTCFTPISAPMPGKSYVSVSPFGGVVVASHYEVSVSNPVSATVSDFIGKTLPLSHPVMINLSHPDEVFSYDLVVGGKAATCDTKESQLGCNISGLGLDQGQTYTVHLDRYFNKEKVETIAEGTMTTLKALTLVNASLTDGKIVYDAPKTFTFEYDKPLASAAAKVTLLDGSAAGQVVASTTTVADYTLTVTLATSLPREASFQLVLQEAEGTDGSTLPEQSTIAFITSGGPKVTGVSVGTISAPLSGTIILSFDQPIANTNAIAQLVTINGLSAQVTQSGNTLRVTYANAPKCTTYTIIVAKGLANAAGIIQSKNWSFTGRTQCYTTQTIGYSHQGRSIVAYIFGSGGKAILYTGAIHGNELSAKALMLAWINEVETNPQNIPTGTQLVIIPAVNPDGVAANNRYNAVGVDLNRNFDTFDWTTDVQTVTGQPYPGGGGTAPESEPESHALADYTRQLAPAMTMSYHGAAGYAIANTCGDSDAVAATYASMVGYRDETGVSGAFGYEITGTYDDWMCERLNYPSVLIELTTDTNSEFSRHKAALWMIAQSS